MTNVEIEFGELCRNLWANQTSKPITRREIEFARAIIAAYQAKLLDGVELPEYKYIDRHDVPKEGMRVYTQDQLQQYAAAAAAQAREKALEEAAQEHADALRKINTQGVGK